MFVDFWRWLLLPPLACPERHFRRRLTDRIVLVTGASEGIGEATADLLADMGATVLLLARTESRLQQVAQRIRERGGQAHVYPADLSDVATVKSVAQHILQEHPHLDAVVSNAGKSIWRPILKTGLKNDLQRSLAVNLLGPSTLILELLSRRPDKNAMTIVNVSTVSAKPPAVPRWSSYQSSKTGFDVWLWSLAHELRSHGVRASSIYLPLVRTRMSSANSLYDHTPALTAAEAAKVVVSAVASPRIRLAPRWLWWQELAVLLFPWATAYVMRLLEGWYRRYERQKAKNRVNRAP